MTNSKRQPYGLGSFVKKFTKPIKKVLKSPLAKTAILGGLGAYGLGALGGGTGWGRFSPSMLKAGLSKVFSPDRFYAPLFYGKNKAGDREFSLGRSALTGLGLAAVGTPLWQKIMKTGPYQEFEEETEDWDVQPSSIANIMSQAKDYYRDYDPYLSSLNYMPPKEFVNPTFYSAKGGLAKLANGGGVAEAQAEQMLKMEYQKYRNQGGTMSYQQFKMQVLRQAQQQGPMAQGQPQMMKKGGRSGYALGEMVEDQESMFIAPQGEEVVTDQMEEIEGQTAGPQWYTELVEHFMYLGYDYDEASDMAWDVGHGKMELGDVPEKKATGGRIGAQEGGLMNLGGMEKDYRNEGGFVPIGGKEKADDVPARLSKNEFVFTADAVRNAGGGDIDAGAQVMENVMKNLEAGGEISEESQGAQGMYNNMKQLETRVA